MNRSDLEEYRRVSAFMRETLKEVDHLLGRDHLVTVEICAHLFVVC